MRTIYLSFAILGAVAPYLFFIRFLREPGAGPVEFAAQLFATSPAAGFTVDLLVTSAVFWLWSFREAVNRGMRGWWLYPVLTLSIGLSFAFPAFLWAREAAASEPPASMP